VALFLVGLAVVVGRVLVRRGNAAQVALIHSSPPTMPRIGHSRRWVWGPVRERRELGGARRADARREVKNG